MTSSPRVPILISAILCGIWLAWVPLTWLLAPTLLIAWWMVRSFQASPYRRVLLVAGAAAMALRLVAVCANGVAAHYSFGFAQPWDVIGDASSYHSHGYYIAQHATGRPMPPYYKLFVHEIEHGGLLPRWDTYQVTGFSYWVAGLFGTFTPMPAAVQWMNALLNVVMALLCFHVARRWAGEWASAASFIAVAWYPTLFAWSVSGLKEWPVIFLSTVFLLVLALASRPPVDIKRAAAAGAALAGVAMLVFFMRRDVASALVVVAIAVMLARAVSFAWAWPFGRAAVLAGGAAALVVTLAAAHSLISQMDTFLQHSAMRALNTSFTELTGGNYRIYPQRFHDHYALLSQGAGYFVLSPAELAMLVPNAVSRLLFSPFPDTLYRSPRLALALPLAFVNLLLAPFVLIGMGRGIHADRWVFGTLALYLGVMSISIGLHCSNAGTAVRLRDMVMPFYLLFAAIGMSRSIRHDSNR